MTNNWSEDSKLPVKSVVFPCPTHVKFYIIEHKITWLAEMACNWKIYPEVWHCYVWGSGS